MTPSQDYGARLVARRKTQDECLASMKRVSYFRLASGIAVLGMIWMAFVFRSIPVWYAGFPALIFGAFLVYHDRLRRDFKRATRCVYFYEQGLDRIENRWQGKGNPGATWEAVPHLYTADLDVFGKGSLFELLCTASTKSGEDTIAAWLRTPASVEEILERQQAVRELASFVDLREDLALLGPEVRSAIQPEFIGEWALRPSRLNSPMLRWGAAGLMGVMLLSLLASAVLETTPWIPILLLTLEALLGVIYRSAVREVLDWVDEPVRELRILGKALERIEREQFSSTRLRALQQALVAGGLRPSQEIARLAKLTEYLDYRRNEFFAILSFPLLWATQFTAAIEAWRQRNGAAISVWMEHFGQFEALSALAGYTYEHPEDVFPSIEAAAASAVLDGEGLRHPLMRGVSCVENSLRLDSTLQLYLISGSNMSGKSTLLRTVGLNAVLALAGGPVRAKRFNLSVFAIGATLRVQDSLQAGVSLFYAEIQRLHDIMELTSGKLPVLFLLDEILHGTNSHDRAIGAEAVVRGLVARGALGLVTTHDLALARVAESMAPKALNVHFQDHMEKGRMSFDYVLRPGVVEKSNALELMRAVGLKV